MYFNRRHLSIQMASILIGQWLVRHHINNNNSNSPLTNNEAMVADKMSYLKHLHQQVSQIQTMVVVLELADLHPHRAQQVSQVLVLVVSLCHHNIR